MKHGWQKNFHEMEIQPRTCMWYNPKYFVGPEDATKYASFRVPAMDRREQNGVGILVFDGMVKGVWLHQWVTKMLVVSRK